MFIYFFFKFSFDTQLQSIPIYYASALAIKCMGIYQTYINQMNERIRKQFAVSNPFIFKHISSIKNASQIDHSGPMVMMASPGNIHNRAIIYISFFTDSLDNTNYYYYFIFG